LIVLKLLESLDAGSIVRFIFIPPGIGADGATLILLQRFRPIFLPLGSEFIERSARFLVAALDRFAPTDGCQFAVHNLNHEQSARRDDLLVGQVLGLARVDPKTGRDENEGEPAEEEATLPLQTRLTQQAFEG